MSPVCATALSVKRLQMYKLILYLQILLVFLCKKTQAGGSFFLITPQKRISRLQQAFLQLQKNDYFCSVK